MPPTESTFGAGEPASQTSPTRGRAGASVIYKPANWFEPLDWRAVFAQDRPIEIDLGCGKGTFLLWAARACPQRSFLGVERLLRRLRRADRQAVRTGLDNIRLLRVEASYLIARLVPDGSVSAYHVLFPDPWPKRRHHSRRLICAPFLADVRRTLAAGGVVNCATDHEEYFGWIQREFQQSGQFVENDPLVLPREAWTDFEREFVEAGKKVYRCRWGRRW
jgi:tRNA (guanine-N7-)-methyltransferase